MLFGIFNINSENLLSFLLESISIISEEFEIFYTSNGYFFKVDLKNNIFLFKFNYLTNILLCQINNEIIVTKKLDLYQYHELKNKLLDIEFNIIKNKLYCLELS